MSHFTVLVVGEDHEAALAPFQENNMADCPKKYLKFHDTEDESRKEWETKSTEYIVLPDGTRKLPWDESFNVKTKKDLFGTKVIPSNAKRLEVPFRETFPTFEDYMKEWCGSEKRDPKLKRFGHWENPNAKWDWYAVGGRWPGKLKVKPQHRDTYPDQEVDSALAGHVDLSELTTFAVLKDGQWYERGSMGWWGCVSDEKNPEEWTSQYRALMESLPADVKLTVVDCHI